MICIIGLLILYKGRFLCSFNIRASFKNDLAVILVIRRKYEYASLRDITRGDDVVDKNTNIIRGCKSVIKAVLGLWDSYGNDFVRLQIPAELIYQFEFSILPITPKIKTIHGVSACVHNCDLHAVLGGQFEWLLLLRFFTRAAACKQQKHCAKEQQQILPTDTPYFLHTSFSSLDIKIYHTNIVRWILRNKH